MRTIEWTRQFKRDHRRVKATPRYKNIDTLLAQIVDLLANDRPLPERNRDHALTGNWIGLRECHLRPNLLLIYDKPGPDVLFFELLWETGGAQTDIASLTTEDIDWDRRCLHCHWVAYGGHFKATPEQGVLFRSL